MNSRIRQAVFSKFLRFFAFFFLDHERYCKHQRKRSGVSSGLETPERKSYVHFSLSRVENLLHNRPAEALFPLIEHGALSRRDRTLGCEGMNQ